MDMTRPIAPGDYIFITEDARWFLSRHFQTVTTGPHRVVGLDRDYDGFVTVDIGYGRKYGVDERECKLAEPPKQTLLDKELAAREGWQVRRDENLRGVFREPTPKERAERESEREPDFDEPTVEYVESSDDDVVYVYRDGQLDLFGGP